MRAPANKLQLKRQDSRLYLAARDFEKLVSLSVLDEIEARLNGNGKRPALPPRIPLDKSLLLLWKALRKAAPESLGAPAAKALLKAIAAHVVQTQASAAPGSPPAAPPPFSARKMQQIEEYVQGALAGGVLVEDIARHVGMSRAQFVRRFKATTGKTPHQFVIETRIRTAKALLTEDYCNLAEIAERTGFANSSHFATVFRRLVRISPSHYRIQVFSGGSARPPAIPASPAASPAPASLPSPALAEFQLEQTSLRISGDVRLLKSSQGLGWTDLYTAATDESPHEGLRGVVPAIWIVTANTPNRILRVDSWGVKHDQTLPRHAISITGSGEAVYDKLLLPLQARHFYLRQETVDEVAREMFRGGGKRGFIQSSFGMGDRVLWWLIASISASLDEPPIGSRLKTDYLAQALAAYLLTRHAAASAPALLPVHALNSRQIGMLGDYINDNLAADMSIAQLAGVVGLGRSQFIRRFKATTAMTPHQYVTQRRIGQARKLIASRSADYATIALLCGFADQSHFIATFKRYTGMTPSEYRRTIA